MHCSGFGVPHCKATLQTPRRAERVLGSPWGLTSNDSALFKVSGPPIAKQHRKQSKRAERVLGGIPHMVCLVTSLGIIEYTMIATKSLRSHEHASTQVRRYIRSPPNFPHAAHLVVSLTAGLLHMSLHILYGVPHVRPPPPRAATWSAGPLCTNPRACAGGI